MIIEKNKIKSSVRITENAYSAIYNLFGQGRREDLEEEIKRHIVGFKILCKAIHHCWIFTSQRTNKIEISFFSSFPQVDHYNSYS